MQIKLNFRSSEPIYLQIMEQVRELVTTGELNPGDQLPTVRQLATDLRVNFNTVARAYRLLDEAGLISTQQGRGTYIWQRPSAEATLRLRQESLSTRTQTFLADAARLGFSPAEVRQTILELLNRWEVLGSPPDVEPQEPTLTE